MEEKISIIIPVYNCEKYIEETIKNIQQQTYSNWEIILIDDASTDNSVKKMKSYVDQKKIILICLPENKGPAYARNRGIERAKGRYICFQDADDLWENEKLEKQLSYMKQHQSSFLYTDFFYMSETGEISKNKIMGQNPLTYSKALKDMRILTISVMIDTQKIEKEAIKMKEIRGGEDVATWWKLLKQGYKIECLNEPLVYYRQRYNSMTSSYQNRLKVRWHLYRKEEQFSILKSSYYFLCYLYHGLQKRK